MPVFPNPSGGSMTVKNEAEARDRGWTPSMGSFGVNSYPESGGGGGGGGGGGSTDLGKIASGFAASAGMTQKQLDEQIREFDATLEWQKKMWEQQGLPQLVIQQRAADLEEKKFAELSQQAHRQQDFVEEIGRRQALLAEKTQTDANNIALGQLGLGQSQLGLNTLQAAAGLSGPSDWIQAANFARGVQGTNLPAFISQLLNGGNTATMGGPAPGAQMSAPLSLGGLAARLGATGPTIGGGPGAGDSGPFGGPWRGGTAPPSYSEQVGMPSGGVEQFTPGSSSPRVVSSNDVGPFTQGNPYMPTAASADAGGGQFSQYYNQRMASAPQTYDRYSAPSSNADYAAQQLRRVYEQGGNALGPQQLEGLSPSEMAMFQGGGGALGADVPGFLEQYKRSRIGQTSAQGNLF